MAGLLPQQPAGPRRDGRPDPLPLLSIGVSAALLPTLSQPSGGVPQGYVRLLVFDADSNYVTARTAQFAPNTPPGGYDELRVEVIVPTDGYVTAYVGNESDADVYFDDVRLEHRQGLQVQETHYDPLGLELAGLAPHTPGLRPLNQYKFNGKEFQADLGLNWNHQDWRFFDPQLGRWHTLDPLSDAGQEMWSPYSFGFNNAVRFNDPDGRCPTCPPTPGLPNDFLARAVLSTGMSAVNLVLQFGARAMGSDTKYQAQFTQDGDGHQTLDVEYVKVPVGDIVQETKTAAWDALSVGLTVGGGGGQAKLFEQAAGKVGVAKLGDAAKLGDLTGGEIKAIQSTVNEAGRPLEVVGSAAKGTRRGVGTELVMLRTESKELLVHGFQTNGIELGFESKMSKAALELEHFEFGIGQHGGKEMIGLGGQGFGGRLAHGGILFERLMVFFHFPPSLVNGG